MLFHHINTHNFAIVNIHLFTCLALNNILCIFFFIFRLYICLIEFGRICSPLFDDDCANHVFISNCLHVCICGNSSILVECVLIYVWKQYHGLQLLKFHIQFFQPTKCEKKNKTKQSNALWNQLFCENAFVLWFHLIEQQQWNAQKIKDPQTSNNIRSWLQ